MTVAKKVLIVIMSYIPARPGPFKVYILETLCLKLRRDRGSVADSFTS